MSNKNPVLKAKTNNNQDNLTTTKTVYNKEWRIQNY